MVMHKFDIDEQIDCAIREMGAKKHLQQLEHNIANKRRMRMYTVSVAASFIIFLSLGINYKLNYDVKKAGYEYNLGLDQRAGSGITALMDNKSIKEALEMIDKARVNVDKEIQNPMYNDSEYLIQLEMDSQELDLLEAVCYMRQGKYFKAKKQLKNIVRENGYYSKEAKNLIDSI